jgi:hypothetical protein
MGFDHSPVQFESAEMETQAKHGDKTFPIVYIHFSDPFRKGIESYRLTEYLPKVIIDSEIFVKSESDLSIDR